MESPIVHLVICVPYLGSNVYVVRPATGGPKKTLNRPLLPARPPVTEVDDNAVQEDSLSDDEAVLLVPQIVTAADPPGIVEAVPTQQACHLVVVANDVIITRRSMRTTTGVSPDRF